MSNYVNYCLIIWIQFLAPEWREYQDWLHDILLAHDQLLASKCIRWKAIMITYWHLSVLLVVVSLTRIKGVVVSVMKLR